MKPHAPAPVRSTGYNRPPGACGNIEFALHFAAWMASCRRPPAVPEIMSRWCMSRATAYRYLARYRDALALEAYP